MEMILCSVEPFLKTIDLADLEWKIQKQLIGTWQTLGLEKRKKEPNNK